MNQGGSQRRCCFPHTLHCSGAKYGVGSCTSEHQPAFPPHTHTQLAQFEFGKREEKIARRSETAIIKARLRPQPFKMTNGSWVKRLQPPPSVHCSKRLLMVQMSRPPFAHHLCPPFAHTRTHRDTPSCESTLQRSPPSISQQVFDPVSLGHSEGLRVKFSEQPCFL